MTTKPVAAHGNRAAGVRCAARHENFPQRRGHALCDPVLRLSTSRAGRSDNRLSCDLCESHGHRDTGRGVKMRIVLSLCTPGSAGVYRSWMSGVSTLEL